MSVMAQKITEEEGKSDIWDKMGEFLTPFKLEVWAMFGLVNTKLE
jgi:hypothetical protein